jgi:hypothetical protein
VESEHAQHAHVTGRRQHDEERLRHRAHGVHVDERVAEQLLAAVSAVDAHEPRFELALRELLDLAGLRVVEQQRLVVDVIRVGERERERLGLAVEDLRVRCARVQAQRREDRDPRSRPKARRQLRSPD